MHKQNRLLILKGNVWQVKVGIPAKHRHLFGGKTAWVESTGTGEIKLARLRRNEIEAAVRRKCSGTSSADTLADRGASLPQAWKTAETTAEEGEFSEQHLIVDSAREAAERMNPKNRKAFEAGWLGLEPVDKYVEAWLAETSLADSTKQEWRSGVGRFKAWADKEGLTSNEINRKAAGRYVSAELAHRPRATASKQLACLGGYWAHLIRRGLVDIDDPDDNPFLRQLGKQTGRQGDKKKMEKERPLTRDEVRRLVDDTAVEDATLADLSLVGVLTGLRLGEILGLTVETIATVDGVACFDLSRAKSEAGVRVVPVHSGLAEVVERRTKGKAKGDLLFPMVDFQRTKRRFKGKNPVSAVSQQFAAYRMKHGIDEVREERRRSLVNFHSLRRTFVTLAHHAGQSEDIVASVVGHATGKRKTQTFGGYSSGPSIEQKRLCVEAVSIPAPPVMSAMEA